MIIDNVHIILNSAASVNFDDPLQEGLKINYFGATRILDLAKECKNLQILTHVSTCYVSCNRVGFCKEEIYNPHEEVDKVVQDIMKRDVKELSENL
jgi:alcohol-forming fatty acyl-CoA reductase